MCLLLLWYKVVIDRIPILSEAVPMVVRVESQE